MLIEGKVLTGVGGAIVYWRCARGLATVGGSTVHTKPPVGNCGTLLYPRTRFRVMGPGTAPGALDPPLRRV